MSNHGRNIAAAIGALAIAIAVSACSDGSFGADHRWLVGSWRHVESCCPSTVPWPGSLTEISLRQDGTAAVRNSDTIVQTDFWITGITGPGQLHFRDRITLPMGCGAVARYVLTRQAQDTMRLYHETNVCDEGATEWQFVRDP